MLATLIPLPYRLLALAGLIAAVGLFGWVKGAGHVQDAWDKATAEQSSVVVRQRARVAKIEAAQQLTTEKISHETDRALARSDAYWGGVRYPATSPGSVPEIPKAAGTTDATSETVAPSPAGCSSADGSADAIVILEWQRWYRGISSAAKLDD